MMAPLPPPLASSAGSAAERALAAAVESGGGFQTCDSLAACFFTAKSLHGKVGRVVERAQVGARAEELEAEARVRRAGGGVAQQHAGRLARLLAQRHKRLERLEQRRGRLHVDGVPLGQPRGERGVLGRAGEQLVVHAQRHAQLRDVEHRDVEVDREDLGPRVHRRLLELQRAQDVVVAVDKVRDEALLVVGAHRADERARPLDRRLGARVERRRARRLGLLLGGDVRHDDSDRARVGRLLDAGAVLRSADLDDGRDVLRDIARRGEQVEGVSLAEGRVDRVENQKVPAARAEVVGVDGRGRLDRQAARRLVDQLLLRGEVGHGWLVKSVSEGGYRP